ncbi:MAG: YlmH/Sll1252 family protein [Alistipes sp.]|nr:YlmH/Sll1252 family protein [Alistipes sp.]
MNEQEQLLCKRLLELANNTYQRDIPMFSDFLNLNVQEILNQILTKMPPICIKTMGGYSLAERKVAGFYPKETRQEEDHSEGPVVCLKVEPLNKKFAEELTHRDYLGALVSLGIDRSVLGDIVVSENSAYLFCLKKIRSFILQELVRIKHTAVMVSEAEFDENVSLHREEITGFTASLRLDAVLALVTGLSRSRGVSYIEEAKVFVNGKCITSNGYTLKENDVISVRGVGKFQYKGTSGTSKKGRLFVTVWKYL